MEDVVDSGVVEEVVGSGVVEDVVDSGVVEEVVGSEVVVVVSAPAADSFSAASEAFVDSFACARRWRCPGNSRFSGRGG